MRHASAPYKVSHVNRSILWRLGGKISHFQQDLNFSSLQDAKFFSRTESVTIISLFDNGADDRKTEHNCTCLEFEGYRSLRWEIPKLVTLLKEFDLMENSPISAVRPNSFQRRWFISWSDRGYVREHAPDGCPVMAPRSVGHRFVNYRAYKYDYVGLPTEPPTLKTLAFGSSALYSLSSLFTISWNGATEVAKWKFCGSNDVSKGLEIFGMTYIDDAFWAFSYAEALLANGTVLGKSDIGETALPNERHRNITKVGLTKLRKQNERVSAYTISTILFADLLISAGLSPLLIARTKKWQLCFLRQAYSRVRDDEKFIDTGELNDLKDDDDSDEESEDGNAADASTRKA